MKQSVKNSEKHPLHFLFTVSDFMAVHLYMEKQNEDFGVDPSKS